jgi:predicted transcriptional regulator
MLRSSLPLGRFFNVDVRIHLSFPLLLVLSVALSVTLGEGAGRGFGLWLALCFAVFVREVARSIAALYMGLRLRAILLLPVGGVMAFRAPDGVGMTPANGADAPDTRWINAIGPLANVAMGLLILGFSLAIDPRVSLLEQPWISLGHILRSFLWLQLLIGAVSVLPISAMNARQLRSIKDPIKPKIPTTAAKLGLTGRGPAFGLGNLLGIAMIIAGILLSDFYWLIGLGVFLMLYVQVANLSSKAGIDGDSILVREVMLTEYSLLSSSDTLRNALDQTVHSLQDIFPVVRGDRLVGSIARQTIAERLLTDGDSYLQGAMLRNLQIATPGEKLIEALRRASNLGASEFIPVVEGNTMIGILTPQSLARAVQQVKLLRPALAPREQRP